MVWIWPRPSARNHLRKRAESAWRLLITKQAIFQEQPRQRNWTNVTAPLHPAFVSSIGDRVTFLRPVGCSRYEEVTPSSKPKKDPVWHIDLLFTRFLVTDNSLFYGIQNSLPCPPTSFIEPYLPCRWVGALLNWQLVYHKRYIGRLSTGGLRDILSGNRWLRYEERKKSSPIAGLEWPRGFQEVRVPRCHDNGTGWW
jgi:hypothetical protein